MPFSPSDVIIDKVDPADYYREFFPDIEFSVSGESTKQICPFHDDTNPSLNANLERGGLCRSCGQGWNDIICFQHLWEKTQGRPNIGREEVEKEMYAKHIRPLISVKVVNGYVSTLLKNKTLMATLLEERGVTRDAVIKWKIGYNEAYQSYTIPIELCSGWYTDVRHMGKGRYKNMPMESKLAAAKKDRGEMTYGTGGRIFPYFALTQKTIYICEGEWDCILLHIMGYSAVTVGSVHDWSKHKDLLRGKDVVIIFDNDTGKEDGSNPGQDAAKKLLYDLYATTKSVCNVVLPDGDVGDFFVKQRRSKEALEALISRARGDETPVEKVKEEVIELDSMADLESGKYYGKRVRVSGRVLGESEKKYTVAKDWTLRCGMDMRKKCDKCALSTMGGEHSGTFASDDPAILNFVDVKDRVVFEWIGEGLEKLKVKCPSLRLDRHSVYTIRPISIGPTMTRLSNKISVDKVLAWSLCGQLELNGEFNFIGKLVHDPNTQRGLFLIDEVEERTLSFRNFVIPSEDRRNELRRKFSPTDTSARGILRHFNGSMDELCINHTFIYGRMLTHAAVILNWFSPLQMRLEHKVVNTYAQTVIIGDTNTGKNEVVERLSKMLGDPGTILDSAATTLRGMIGGVGADGEFGWGIIPLNHGRSLTLDEGTSIAEMMNHLRVVRDGKADYATAYGKRQTMAMVRLIILANDPSGSVSNNAYPVKALPALIKAEADMSRFTSAHFLRQEDVDVEVLNRASLPKIDSDITDDDRRELLTFCWSRGEEHYLTDKEAAETLNKCAAQLAKKYCVTIPLVQPAVMKTKLLGVAGAMAGYQYNIDDGGSCVVVTTEYIKAAYLHIQENYDDVSCQYDKYSESIRRQATIDNVKEVDKIFELEEKFIIKEKKTQTVLHSIRYLLDHSILDRQMMGDAFLHAETNEPANVLTKTLSVNRCLERSGRGYRKTSAFVKYLREKLEKEDNDG